MTSKRYETLDGLRGVAAAGVMIFHFSILGITDLFPRAFLAVQFFFVLSGFALSCAYEKKALTLSIAQFAKKRLTHSIQRVDAWLRDEWRTWLGIAPVSARSDQRCWALELV